MKPPGKTIGRQTTPDVRPSPSSSGDIQAFVNRVKAMTPAGGTAGRGRLLFALDATMSRQPTWDLACSLQGEMFKTLAETQALSVQLLYFRGLGECRASKWVADPNALARLMSGIDCRGGHTQIGKVFSHARAEHGRQRINAIVYVGDAMEEDVDALSHKAGELGLLGCPIFIFQEGHVPGVEPAFREFARLSKGAYARFDASAPDQLASLLRAVAAYAAGGRNSLQLQNNSTARALLAQLR
ncbi:VWA domain-containing protein [Arsenicitalea aurantiaca]|uniref:VWA domain-containing protein n=1 Tax=Arsenicitalea aurantiaca TaxID=1783274 RepID=A0A433X3F8_9HYPH|nr:VWA domain-containing protein [Arsenicitalea aurantiaca]RUT28599.1 VWA domain-containing protein [Arsenicitalea aurantiaca]